MNDLRILKLLGRLWYHISPLRRRQFGALTVLMLLASFSEVVSIGAVVPFLSVMVSPEMVFTHSWMQPIIKVFDVVKPEQLLLPLTIIFGLLVVISGAIRLSLLWVSTRLSFAAGADLSIYIYRSTLYQSYAVHCARNSSEIINGVFNKTSIVINSVIVPTVTLLSAMIMLITVFITLVAIEPVVALMAFGGFGLIYIFVIRFTRKKLFLNSQRVAHESTQVIKSLQEGLGGIRDVLIGSTQEFYCKIYQNSDLPLRHAQGSNLFIGTFPRFGIETLGMLLIISLAYILSSQGGGVTKAIPILGALALGAQRLLPAFQQAYGAWSGIRSEQASLQDVLELLDQPLPDYVGKPVEPALSFKNCIKLKNISFRYSQQSPFIFEQFNLTIVKGSRIGFIGTTGSGKSTLLDIIMGLQQPTKGTFEVDNHVITLGNNRAWQANIAHVPQSIYLADSSIAENIAFGLRKDQIDLSKVRKAASQAQISETIESWPEQYQTPVGELGVRLSGGQRQRIGIARALYKEADVIILDEATSSLDNETEQVVMEAIESLSSDLTLLIIAHRLTTLKNCKQIVQLGENGIVMTGSYADIIN